MSVIELERLAETGGAGRLGRHREHDERSRAYSVSFPPGNVRSVRWTRQCPIFDQGDVGSCTGNAMAGAIGTNSEGIEGASRITEATALQLYQLATRLDRFPGVYPPQDTGSSGLAVAKAAVRLGYISRYLHAFSVTAALRALQRGPVIVGITWLTGCDSPDETGLVRYVGEERGGHEVELLGVDVDRRLVTFANSWSTSWGRDGYFDMSLDDFGKALRQGGDVTVPVWRAP